MSLDNNITKKIRIWDLPTRIYHWLQVVIVFAALLSGFFAPEWWLNYHIWIGYALIGLLVFRIVWGFFGSHYSRFISFVFSPKTLISHLNGIIKNKPLHFLGHNPLGAIMVFALIATLMGIIISGIVNLGGVENLGALAGFVDYAKGAFAGDIHKVLAFVLIALILFHLFGVVFESKIGKENLTKAMLDGNKTLIANEAKPELKSPLLLPAYISLGVLAIVLIAGYVGMSKVPASGFISMPLNGDYQSECSDCHMVYHPSLLPKKSWAIMMSDLENHFGEDASLDDETRDDIAAYLNSFSAENWDSEVANKFLIIDEKSPEQITATPYWKLRHSKINKEIFKSKPVRTAANCEACHKDAKTGRFDDVNIKIPKPKQL